MPTGDCACLRTKHKFTTIELPPPILALLRGMSATAMSLKRGIISFLNVDDSRFTRVDEIEFAPYFSKYSWGFFRRKTKLLCRKCCNHIALHHSFPSTEPSPPTEASSPMKYDIRIRALQPSSSQEYGITVLA
ncbi:chloroplastic protein [Glycine max]|nr:chloroplastic protein [Glycine max]